MFGLSALITNRWSDIAIAESRQHFLTKGSSMKLYKKHLLTLLAFIAIAAVWSLILYQILIQITEEI